MMNPYDDTTETFRPTTYAAIRIAIGALYVVMAEAHDELIDCNPRQVEDTEHMVRLSRLMGRCGEMIDSME